MTEACMLPYCEELPKMDTCIVPMCIKWGWEGLDLIPKVAEPSSSYSKAEPVCKRNDAEDFSVGKVTFEVQVTNPLSPPFGKSLLHPKKH